MPPHRIDERLCLLPRREQSRENASDDHVLAGVEKTCSFLSGRPIADVLKIRGPSKKRLRWASDGHL